MYLSRGLKIGFFPVNVQATALDVIEICAIMRRFRRKSSAATRLWISVINLKRDFRT